MFGVITLAHGPKRYVDMAINMAISLRYTNPGIKCAIITDAAESTIYKYFDMYIPLNKEYGSGLNQKLYLNKYSPFDETLFIDSDCILVKSLNCLYNICKQHDFVVFGNQVSKGNWYMDIEGMCLKLNVLSLPKFNGGAYYFKKGKVTDKIYSTAKELNTNYKQLGFEGFRGGINEEPIISVSLAINGIDAVEDFGMAMRTPIGIMGDLKIDCLRGYATFNKNGQIVNPAIVHFCGSYADAFHYNREVVKIRIMHKFKFIAPKLISAITNTVLNTYYFIYVFCKRFIKFLIRKEKFNYKIFLPIYSNQ